jgi:hypothetical protein
MAKFVHIPSSSGTDLYVNVDTIRWVAQSSRNADESSMYFDHQQSLSIKETAASFISRVLAAG